MSNHKHSNLENWVAAAVALSIVALVIAFLAAVLK